MDPIEKQIRELFSNISYNGKSVLDANIVYSLEIENDTVTSHEWC